MLTLSGGREEFKRVIRQKAIIPLGKIEERILLIRGQRVMLDADLAGLYGVSTKRLNEQVRRNKGRFPEDFMFQLTTNEKAEVVANCDHLAKLRFSPVLPNAFTEHGAIMVASVLNTQRAIQVSVFVVRAFVKLREMLSTHKELAHKLAALERKLQNHDESIRSLVAAIRQLMAPPEPEPPKKRIGFLIEEPHVPYESSKGYKKQKR
jgi:phage regulator Rha-like protein